MGHTGNEPANSSYDRLRYWPKATPITPSYEDLEVIIKTFHKYCDPVDMTYEDHLVWEGWNRKFHPENYDETND